MNNARTFFGGGGGGGGRALVCLAKTPPPPPPPPPPGQCCAVPHPQAQSLRPLRDRGAWYRSMYVYLSVEKIALYLLSFDNSSLLSLLPPSASFWIELVLLARL